MSDIFKLAGKEFSSRLIVGTGKYRSFSEMKAAHQASGSEMVTVAVNRVPLDRKTESFLDHLDPKMHILPNTAGCFDADHAIRTARLAREALETDWLKLEVIGDPITLFPDNEQTLEAAKILVEEGFIVLPYFTDDLIMAKKLLDAGCAASHCRSIHGAFEPGGRCEHVLELLTDGDHQRIAVGIPRAFG